MTSDTFFQVVSDSMSRNELEHILHNLHLFENTKLDNNDKFCKIRPMINDLNKKIWSIHSVVKRNQSTSQWYHNLSYMVADKEQITSRFVLVISFGSLLKPAVMSFSLNPIRLLKLVNKLPLKQDRSWEEKLC